MENLQNHLYTTSNPHNLWCSKLMYALLVYIYIYNYIYMYFFLIPIYIFPTCITLINTHTYIPICPSITWSIIILKKWTYIINSMIKNYYKVKLLKLSGTVKFSSCERSGMSAGGGCLQQSCRRTQGLASPLFRLSQETRGRRTVLRRRISTQTANLAQPDK